ncbi:MAG: sugar kinase, partial [Myxococcota bacterium]
GGPFRTRTGAILGIGSPDGRQRAALAALYAALVTDLCLDLVGARGQVIVEGRFARDEAYCAVLAALRRSQEVLVSADETGTLAGAALLARWPELGPAPELRPVRLEPRISQALHAHRARWRTRVAVD